MSRSSTSATILALLAAALIGPQGALAQQDPRSRPTGQPRPTVPNISGGRVEVPPGSNYRTAPPVTPPQASSRSSLPAPAAVPTQPTPNGRAQIDLR